jgi:hypothetical protein
VLYGSGFSPVWGPFLARSSLPKGARGAPICIFSACQEGVVWFLCIFVSHPLEGSLCLLMGKPSGLHLLDEPLKGFIVNLADLPWKWIKRLAASSERVSHGSWWKCTTSLERKTGISAVLTVTSGLGSLLNRWWTLTILMIQMLTYDYYFCYTLILFTWSCGYLGLMLNLLWLNFYNCDSLKAKRSKSVSTFWASWTPCYIAEYEMYLHLLYIQILEKIPDG